MTSNIFSVGRDCQLVVMGPFGRIDLTHVTGFEAHQLTRPIRIDRIDGVQLAAELPKGWDGFFDLERGSSVAEDFIAAIEAAYFAGTPCTSRHALPICPGERRQHQHLPVRGRVVFKLSQAGAWRGDASVKQKLEFFAAKRKRV